MWRTESRVIPGGWSLQGRGDHLVSDVEEYVARSHFFQKFPLDGVQPQDLGKTLLMGLLLGQEAGGIIGRGLGLAQTSAGRPDIFFLQVDIHRIEPLG